MLPLDLHVLSLSLAFILSQDQTLHCTFYFFVCSLNSSVFIVVNFWRWYFYLPCTYTTFLLFSIFQRTVSVFVETDCKVTTFFWIDKIFQKKYLFFFSNVCLFNSQATSLDCGCKVTAFSETTKIFLCFFWKFFVTRYILRRKIFIETLFLCFFTRFLCFFTLFFARKNMLKNIIFRVFGFFSCFFMKN